MSLHIYILIYTNIIIHMCSFFLTTVISQDFIQRKSAGYPLRHDWQCMIQIPKPVNNKTSVFASLLGDGDLY